MLKFDSCFTTNKSIAVGGSSVSIYHIEMLQELGVETIIIAFDNDYSKFPDEEGDYDKLFGLKKALKEANKLYSMGFKVELIYDFEQEYLDNHDSPIDKGREVYSKLYRERKNFEELKELLTKEVEKSEVEITDF